LFASYDYAELRRDDDPDPMDDFQQFEDEDISEWLLTLAAIARVTDDELGTLKNVEKNFPDGVGTLEEGGQETRLSIREACNKIIHAKKCDTNLGGPKRIRFGADGLKPKAMMSNVSTRLQLFC
jgi:hypothetical protein